MATVTALTAARANTAVASAAITNGNLILTKLDGSTVNVGAVGGGGGSGATNAWLTGTADPSAGTGVDGDWYLTSTTGKILQKVAGSWVTRITTIIGAQGAQGIQGVAGAAGAAGQGVPTGGTTGQVLRKTSNTNFATEWATPSSTGVSNLETVFPVTFAKMLSSENAIPPTASNSVPVGYFRVPYGFTINSVRAFQSVADNTTATIIDIHQGTSAINTSILATRITIDATEKSSKEATTQPAVGSVNISDDAELFFYLDQRGDAARGITVWIMGTRDLTAVTSAPSAPTSLQNTSTLAPNMGFSWVLPASNGDPLIRQEVDWKQSSSSTWPTTPTSISSTATTYSFGGTVAGQTFDFRVRGVNNNGPGPYTTITGITATSGGTPAVPSAPTNLVNTSTLAPNMGFSWTIPATNNDPLIRQEVEWKQSASAWADVNTDKLTTDTTHAFGGTVAGQSFDFRVRGVSNTGDGPWATISNVVATSTGATARSIAPSTTNWGNISYDTIPGGTWTQATQLTNGLGANFDSGSPTFRAQIYQGSVFEDQPYFGSTQALCQFDTGVGGTLSAGSAELRMYLANDNSGTTDFNVDVYLYDFGTTVTEANMRTSAQVASLTKIGHFASSGIGAVNSLKTMTVTNRTAFEAAINTATGGTLRLLFVNQLFLTANSAAIDEVLGLNFNRANSRLEFTS